MRATLFESRLLQALPIALLLILTTWGNVLAMFALSTFIFLCGMLLFSRDDEICSADGRAALIGAGAAIAVAGVMMIWNLL